MENTIITPNVPSSWVAVWDEEYNEWFYVNESTGQSQWEPPMGTTFQGSINQAPPYLEPSVQHQRDSQQPTNCQQQQTPVVITEPTHNRSKMKRMGGFLGGVVGALLLGDILAQETNGYGRGRFRRSRFRRNRFGRFGPGGYVPGVYGPNLFGPGVVVPGGFGPAGFGVGW